VIRPINYFDDVDTESSSSHICKSLRSNMLNQMYSLIFVGFQMRFGLIRVLFNNDKDDAKFAGIE
jgi:hypothetical protein